jgi:hypothetical protein
MLGDQLKTVQIGESSRPPYDERQRLVIPLTQPGIRAAIEPVLARLPALSQARITEDWGQQSTVFALCAFCESNYAVRELAIVHGHSADYRSVVQITVSPYTKSAHEIPALSPGIPPR